MKRLAVLACVLALSACGGGSEVAAPIAPVAAARPAPQALRSADLTTGLLRVYQAFFGRAPTAAEWEEITAPTAEALATSYFTGIGHMGDAELASVVLAHMGVTSQTVNANSLAILQTALTQYFAAYGNMARGVIANNLVNLLPGLVNDPTWGAAARAFNAQVDAARVAVATCTPSVTTGFRGNFETLAASAEGAAAGGGFGKVLGGSLSITDLSTGRLVAQGTTDTSTGLATVKTCTLTGPFLLKLEGRAGARYYDAGRAALVDFPAGTALNAMVDVWEEHVGISALSEAAYRYALGSLGGTSAAQVRDANRTVLGLVNALLATPNALASVNSLPVQVDASSTATVLGAGRYAAAARVNGGLARQAAAFNSSLATPALAFAAELARDIADGRIDGLTSTGQRTATGAGSYELARLPVHVLAGLGAVAGRFGTADTPLTLVDETSNAISACGFVDRVGLMANGEVRIVRRKVPLTDITSGVTEHPVCSTARQPGLLRGVMTDVTALQGLGAWTLAVKADGSVHVLGDLVTAGQFPGVAAGVPLDNPQRIDGFTNVTSVANAQDAFARTADGSVWDFGRANRRTPTDDWRTSIPTTLTRMPELSNIARVRAVGADSYVAIDHDGNVFGWGLGYDGVLANGTRFFSGAGQVGTIQRIEAPRVARPAQIASLSNVVDIAYYRMSVMALHRDGTVSVWGTDESRIFGRGTEAPSLRPTRVADVSGVRQIGASANGFLLLKNDGSLVEWTAGGTPLQAMPSVRALSLSRAMQEEAKVHLVSGAVVAPGAAEDRAAAFR
ncbi:RCC1 domain-containing protein [Ramlibacter albus]|uniref:Uncharacterized protein n=1 Tax=Ramlibacter albus TaxID=2079448 RepID=A0A923M5I3_9BURK|nr:hypothetical protein [Ramlibacter albus]MBC5764592.1 hypothetical protein [Ramlibacter albus]